MSGEAFDCDVLIVGYGPVGAVLAGLLGANGVSAIVIDKERDVYPLPRAAHFDHEVMRVYQQLGVADAVLEHAQPAPVYEFRSAGGELLVNFEGLSLESSSGWTTGYMFYQPGVERALRSKVEMIPGIDVRTGRMLLGFEQHADAVEASVAGPDGTREIRARYLVGCDGASSSVRAAMGVKLHDFMFDEPWLVLDTRVLDVERVPKVNLQMCDPARPTTCVLMGPGRHRWEFMLLPGETPEQVLAGGFVASLLEKWDCADAVEVERTAVYRFHGLVAESWRDRRVLLAGDAAHQMPPFAGQGMCSGIRDAANLAWKLRAVLRDGADERLLDTYQAERDPHVRTFIQLAIAMGRVVCTLDPVQAKVRDAGMLAALKSGAPALAPVVPPPFKKGSATLQSPHAGSLFVQPWSSVAGETVRLDDVLGGDAWLLTTNAAPQAPSSIVATSLNDPVLAPFRDALAKWLGACDAGSVLVRPDRYVFGTGNPEALLAAYDACLHPALQNV